MDNYDLKNKRLELHEGMNEKEILEVLGFDDQSPYYEDRLYVVTEFLIGNVREEHYNKIGERFNALSLKIIRDETAKDLGAIWKRVKSLPIRPAYVFVSYPGSKHYTLDFYPNVKFHFESWIDYMILSLSFIDYIESLDDKNIKFSNCFDHDPSRVDPNAPILSGILFTKELFDCEETMLM